MHWQPTTIRRFIKGFSTSARTALVTTDAGPGYLKALGAPEGPHTLAAELVATQLARWFKLSTFDFAIVTLDEVDEIPFVDNQGNRTGLAAPGPAFITRQESGETWSGDEKQLRRLVNPQDIARLVVFDTWVLNCDRHSHPAGKRPHKPRVNRGNVFLSEEAPAGQLLLKAMDHTHCFTCGAEWTKKLAQIGIISDTRIFGLFPEFRRFLNRDDLLQAIADLRRIRQRDLVEMTTGIPNEWDVSPGVTDSLVELLLRRATYVADTIENNIWPQREFGYDEEKETEPEP
jgi:hypothetical protein